VPWQSPRSRGEIASELTLFAMTITLEGRTGVFARHQQSRARFIAPLRHFRYILHHIELKKPHLYAMRLVPARPAGLEPATPYSASKCSNPLSYGRNVCENYYTRSRSSS
jgi:hypothetical protein